MNESPSQVVLGHPATPRPLACPLQQNDSDVRKADAAFRRLWDEESSSDTLHTSELHYRPLDPSDLDMLWVAHAAVLPIDYDFGFYNAAVHASSGVFSWAALHSSPGQPDVLIGFVTARIVRLVEVDRLERMLMDLHGMLLDGQHAAYILTLGVAHPWRGAGVASRLVDLLLRSAQQRGCVAAYLHMLRGNDAAQCFYTRHGFEPRGLLQDFYCIESDRQPDASRTLYDALLYCRHLDAPWALPGPLSFLRAATAPLQSLVQSFASTCAPAWQPAGVPVYSFGQQSVDPSRVVPLGTAAAALEAHRLATPSCLPALGWCEGSTRQPWLQWLFVRHGRRDESGLVLASKTHCR